MSIRPVDFNGMIQRTQDVSTLKQNEDNRPCGGNSRRFFHRK